LVVFWFRGFLRRSPMERGVAKPNLKKETNQKVVWKEAKTQKPTRCFVCFVVGFGVETKHPQKPKKAQKSKPPKPTPLPGNPQHGKRKTKIPTQKRKKNGGCVAPRLVAVHPPTNLGWGPRQKNKTPTRFFFFLLFQKGKKKKPEPDGGV